MDNTSLRYCVTVAQLLHENQLLRAAIEEKDAVLEAAYASLVEAPAETPN